MVLYYGDSIENNEYATKVVFRRSQFLRVQESDDFDSIIKDMADQINSYIDQVDSFKFAGFLGFTLSCTKYDPFAGGSYMEKSKPLQGTKKGLINIKNMDNERCFWYCLLLGIVTPEVIGEHPELESKYKNHINKIKFPTSTFKY